MTKRKSLAEVMEKSLDTKVRDDLNSPLVPDEPPNVNVAQPGNAATASNAKRHKWVQMNVFVPGEVRDAFKLQALKERRDMSDIVAELLIDYLNRN